MLGSSWIAAQMEASQEGLSFTKLVIADNHSCLKYTEGSIFRSELFIDLEAWYCNANCHKDVIVDT
jgi:hypothetical protein